MILAWLITTASWALFRKTFRSSSIPITNMKRINPIWLKNCKFPREAAGKRVSLNSGKYNPNKEGPSTIPAIISPTTEGCPIFLQIHPKNRATKIIVKIWASKMAKGCCKLCCIESTNSAHCDLSEVFSIIVFPCCRCFPWSKNQ
ncbi:hypothetical protein D9M72_535240 [compost metagenome]